MASYTHTGAVTGSTVSDSNIAVRSILISSSSASAQVTLKGNGVTAVILYCPAGDSRVYPAVSGGNQFSLEQIPGPVTVDIVGAATFVRISY